MTDFRAFGQELVGLVDQLDAANDAVTAKQAELDATVQQYAVERAALQQQLAAITADEAADEQKILDIQAAFDAYKAAHPDAPVIDLHEFADFTQSGSSSGLMLAGDLVGKGSGTTVYRMKPDTATKPFTASTSVATALIRAGWSGQKVNLQGFTLDGTHQGAGVNGGAEQEYHGLISKGGAGSTISDVTLTGIPGHGSSPIESGGETASLSLLRAGAHTLTNVNLDGRRGGTGAGIAASLFEMNYMTAGMTWNGGRANYATGGFGAALFQCGGTNIFNGVDFRFNRKGLNEEESVGGVRRYIRCDFRGSGAAFGYILQATTRILSVSTKITFEDCLFDGDLCSVNTYGPSAIKDSAGNPLNGQKDADIRRLDTVAGVLTDVTGNPAKFQITHK